MGYGCVSLKVIYDSENEKANGHIDRSIDLTLLHFLELTYYLDDDSDRGPINKLELLIEGKQIPRTVISWGTILMRIEFSYT